ncbi:MAG: TlyA family RNA methyltransferase [Nitrospinae bacterium]|nr:TlyA family RNA methyltransferase [Nitrospinota bacterium]
MILGGRVRVDGTTADKPGRMVREDCALETLEDAIPYVSRGGLKLERALDAFGVSPAGKTAADIGSSTGGFTDCLLQRGASRVYAVDVGYGQLDWKLQTDPRVTVVDRKNARHLTLEDLGEAVDLAVIDVSFISLKLVIPPALKLLKPGGELIALLKPQFEVGKGEVEKKGIVKTPEKHLRVALALRDFMEEVGWVLCGCVASPIEGRKGNREFLLHCLPRERGTSLDDETIRTAVLEKS